MGTGLILMVFCEFAAPGILRLFGATGSELIYAVPYIRIYLIGTVFSMIVTGMNPFINAQGYSIIGMITVVIGAVCNIVLDPIFMFTMGLGVNGAAIATVISQSFQYSAQTVFKALNKKRQAVFFSIFRKIILVVPLTFLLQTLFHMGTDGVFIAEPVSNVIGGFASMGTMLLTVLPELKRMETKNEYGYNINGFQNDRCASVDMYDKIIRDTRTGIYCKGGPYHVD